MSDLYSRYIKRLQMSNIHEECKYYVKENDMCLLFFQLGYFNVSQYKECLEEEIYDE